MGLNLNYSLVEIALVVIEGVPEEKLPAFRARLRLLKRLGFPPGVNTGKGKHVSYGAGELLLLALALQLVRLGQTSEEAANVLRAGEIAVRDATARALQVGLTKEPVYLLLRSPGLFAGQSALLWREGSKLGSDIAKSAFASVAIINLSSVLRAVIGGMFMLLEGAELAFRRGLEDWLKQGEEGDDVNP